MTKVYLILILMMLSFKVFPQSNFRHGIFLHHSTGLNIWGPNGSSTSIPEEMVNYNSLHGFSGNEAVTMNEEWWSPPDNEWVTWHNFFDDPSPVTGIGQYLPDNPIVVIKTCFPASAISTPGIPSDTLNPALKSVYNYKWHWRHIIRVMQSYPDNFFAIWTNAPLEPNSTTSSEAVLSKWFCTWAKDTLAMGLDPEFGMFPDNVYVFDFFSKLTGPDGMMLMQYAAGPGDSHPNAIATELVAPQFVTEIFDAAIGYENVFADDQAPDVQGLHITAGPNPFKKDCLLKLEGELNGPVEVVLIEPSGRSGRLLWKGNIQNQQEIRLSGEGLVQGWHLIRFNWEQGSKIIRVLHL